MKDYEFATAMAEGYGNRFSKALDAVVSAINSKQLDMLNMEAVKSRVAEAMRAIEVKIRFDTLNAKAKGKLTCNSTGFELDTHKFETLDEVEKALDNKAFL